MTRWLKILKIIAPVVLSLIPGLRPGAGPLISVLVEGIGLAESLGLPGEEKKAYVMGLASAAMNGINMVRPPEHQIPTAPVLAAVDQGIDTTVATVNALHALREP